MSEIIVHWDGNYQGPYSFDIVNRELITRLNKRNGIRIATLPRDGEEHKQAQYGIEHLRPEQFGKGADVIVRHRWPPRFSNPGNAYYIHCQPFEYGTIPIAWREGLQQNADEIWCLSNYVRDVYIDAGFSPEQLTVIPNGFDLGNFSPSTARTSANSDESFLRLSFCRRLYCSQRF